MTVNHFIKFFESKYPLKNAEDWDNNGLLFGNKRQILNNVVVALDLTTEVMDEAIKNKSDLIITHHPFLLASEIKETKNRFYETPYKKSIYNRIINTGIAVYAAHTNFDNASNGMADTFIKMLGFKSKDIPGAIYGKFFESTMNFTQLTDLISKKIGISKFISNANKNAFHTRIAVLPGSGSTEEIIAADKAGVGIIITSDVKWNQWITIEEMNINVIQVTHAMEDVFTQKVMDLINHKFKELNVFPVFAKEIAK